MECNPVYDAGNNKAVPCYERQVAIPTYPVQDADPNPMFMEKRVYQGSSGKVSPNPFIDCVALHKGNAEFAYAWDRNLTDDDGPTWN
jgi:hypothetical protein